MSPDAQQDFAFAFLSILFEGAPFILLGTLLSGLIDIYLPPGTMDRLLPKKTLPATLVAGLLGFILPVCECAVVPVIRRLVKKGLPVSCALTYMLAAPIVNPITALSTWKAFGGSLDPERGGPPIPLGPDITADASHVMTASRLGLGFLVAVLVGLIVARIPLGKILRPRLLKSIEEEDHHHNHHHDHAGCDHDHHHNHSKCGHDHDHAPNSGQRLVAAMRSAMRDFVDVGVYFVIGVTITALFNTGIAPGAEWLDSLAASPAVAPAALMALAFILSLCSTSDAFIAATLDKFTWGAKLAFLTFGPMMDVKLIFLYQTVLKRRFILALALGLFVVIGLACIAWQAAILALQP
ncbi:MAG: permease [Verrucomicrobiota bacterium]